ncbi:hypothetical protein K4L06_05185 [Lysobacter sp. BMK333-48F3]|uniref:hypothetical protein n=1 Tax=Lysobacter sp. BMK333-48F3 TaxID=2867962 RepID=UPI001C8B7467|nr:hypothetical protein [Lysobacter sp. BMK333-48F3]MBX9400697.1 hypothetical protein [Lysobacter sp. BMK333-48F3]
MSLDFMSIKTGERRITSRVFTKPAVRDGSQDRHVKFFLQRPLRQTAVYKGFRAAFSLRKKIFRGARRQRNGFTLAT